MTRAELTVGEYNSLLRVARVAQTSHVADRLFHASNHLRFLMRCHSIVDMMSLTGCEANTETMTILINLYNERKRGAKGGQPPVRIIFISHN